MNLYREALMVVDEATVRRVLRQKYRFIRIGSMDLQDAYPGETP